MTIYSRIIIVVKSILVDMDFDKTIYELMENVVIKISSAKENVSEIERTIYIVKARTWIIFNVMAFKCLHKLLIINIVYFSELYLNAFSLINLISEKFHQGKLW